MPKLIEDGWAQCCCSPRLSVMGTQCRQNGGLLSLPHSLLECGVQGNWCAFVVCPAPGTVTSISFSLTISLDSSPYLQNGCHFLVEGQEAKAGRWVQTRVLVTRLLTCPNGRPGGYGIHVLLQERIVNLQVAWSSTHM